MSKSCVQYIKNNWMWFGYSAVFDNISKVSICS
jgi:hypothetical protein